MYTYPWTYMDAIILNRWRSLGAGEIRGDRGGGHGVGAEGRGGALRPAAAPDSRQGGGVLRGGDIIVLGTALRHRVMLMSSRLIDWDVQTAALDGESDLKTRMVAPPCVLLNEEPSRIQVEKKNPGKKLQKP